jgi:predicted component of type VI protein secretion system
VPSRRPASLWNLYVQQHAKMDDEAKDQFKGVFGDAFLDAYEAEVQRFNKKAGK